MTEQQLARNLPRHINDGVEREVNQALSKVGTRLEGKAPFREAVGLWEELQTTPKDASSGMGRLTKHGQDLVSQIYQASRLDELTPAARKTLETLARGISGLPIQEGVFRRIGQLSEVAETLGDKYARHIPGVGKVVAVGGALAAAGSASAAELNETGDLRSAAHVGAKAGFTEARAELNSESRFTRAVSDLRQGNISVGLARGIEGVAEFVVGAGGKLERDRVEPAAEETFRNGGAKGLTAEVIKTGEDPKYILLGNNTLPETIKVQGKGEVPLHEALQDKVTRDWYKGKIKDQIEASSGERREMWQAQLDTVKGFEEASARFNPQNNMVDRAVNAHLGLGAPKV